MNEGSDAFADKAARTNEHTDTISDDAGSSQLRGVRAACVIRLI